MNNNWEFDYSELYNNNNPGRNAQNTTAPEAESPLQGAPGPAGMPGMGVGGAPVPPHAAQKKRGWGKRVAAGAAAVVFCGAVGFGGGYLGYTFAKGGSTGPVIYQAPAASSGTGSAAGGTANTADALSVTEIASKVGPSVVEVTTEAVTTNAFFGQYVQSGAGSGVIITEDGYILTNYHVIDGANSIKVTFSDGKEYTATYVGGEEANDIAVIKVEATGLTPVVIGSSSDMLVGEQVTTIGNPLGELTFSETTGIISALDRTITMSDGNKMNMIQTDCAINSGNSGGPLFNSHGEVIGIVSAKYSSSASSSSASVEGLGFAIPMDDVADMVSELVTNGYVTGKPLMGISVGDVAEDVQAYGVPAGAAVKVVTPGLCGEKAGLQEGDIITKINDTEVASGNDLITAKDNYKPGDTVNLTVYRDGKTITVKLTLEESTPEKTAQQDQAQKEYEEQQQQQLQQEQQQGSGGWPFGGFGY